MLAALAPRAARRAAAAAAPPLARAASGAAEAGQPTHATHPHALAPGELAPGVSPAELTARRDALAARLPPGGVALLPAAPRTFVAGVIPHPYRPDADAAHFTGLTQPGCVGAIVAGGGGEGGRGGHRFVLFVPDADARAEAWDGAPVSVGGARDAFGADDAYPMSELDARLAPLLASAPSILADPDRPADPALASSPALGRAASAGRVRALRPHAHDCRWLKSPAELALMRTSAALAARGMGVAMAVSGGGEGGAAVSIGRAPPSSPPSFTVPRTEAGLAAAFEFAVKAGGADRLAYPPVVASGADAATIHYSRNDKPLAPGALVLVDAGCEYWGYASDVTRTWPAAGGGFGGGGGGRASAAADVYDAVAAVHARLLASVRPGITLAALHAEAVHLLSQAAAGLGASSSPASMRYLFPHSIGHWLGRDVHDCGAVPPTRPLAPGAVLAVEPGLYFPPAPHAPPPLAGIGVRIEDVVAVTEGGCEVLSAAAPVERRAVERAVNGEAWEGGGDAASAAAAAAAV